MRCGVELSADEILGEPDDQVVVHAQRDAALPESGIVGLPYDRRVSDGSGTARGNKAGTVWFRVTCQVPSRLVFAVTDDVLFCALTRQGAEQLTWDQWSGSYLKESWSLVR